MFFYSKHYLICVIKNNKKITFRLKILPGSCWLRFIHGVSHKHRITKKCFLVMQTVLAYPTELFMHTDSYLLTARSCRHISTDSFQLTYPNWKMSTDSCFTLRALSAWWSLYRKAHRWSEEAKTAGGTSAKLGFMVMHNTALKLDGSSRTCPGW